MKNYPSDVFESDEAEKKYNESRNFNKRKPIKWMMKGNAIISRHKLETCWRCKTRERCTDSPFAINGKYRRVCQRCNLSLYS